MKNQKNTLVIMAAGMGRRYGGLKQIDPVGPNGELIIDYSVHDALNAGFQKIVFVIKKSIEHDFHHTIGKRIGDFCETEYVFQEIDSVPVEGFLETKRIKPWGTGHAVLTCKDAVPGPFAVINADDFYGASSFAAIHKFLSNLNEENIQRYCMVGYALKNTISESGYVSRGICSVDERGLLEEINERTQIQKFEDRIKYSEDLGNSWIDLDPNVLVSMNMWGFSKSIFEFLRKAFKSFIQDPLNLENREFFLPEIVNDLVQGGIVSVRVKPTLESWAGVTYQEDKRNVINKIQNLILSGKYPEKLWEKQ